MRKKKQEEKLTSENYSDNHKQAFEKAGTAQRNYSTKYIKERVDRVATLI